MFACFTKNSIPLIDTEIFKLPISSCVRFVSLHLSRSLNFHISGQMCCHKVINNIPYYPCNSCRICNDVASPILNTALCLLFYSNEIQTLYSNEIQTRCIFIFTRLKIFVLLSFLLCWWVIKKYVILFPIFGGFSQEPFVTNFNLIPL